MLSPDGVAVLVARHKAAQARISGRTGLKVATIWDALGSWDRADVERFAEQTGPAITAAKRAAVVLAAGFYAQILQRRAPAVTIGSIIVDFNAEAAFTATWHALTERRPFLEAVTAGQAIATAEVDRFVASSARRTGDHVTRALRVHTGWERVPAADACPWCIDVSGQTYKTSETADFGHDRCGCTAIPVEL